MDDMGKNLDMARKNDTPVKDITGVEDVAAAEETYVIADAAQNEATIQKRDTALNHGMGQ